MSTSDFENYWSKRYHCNTCGTGHNRMEWNSLGMCCGRCGAHTGNNSQGHYWGLCSDETFRAKVEAKYQYKVKSAIPFSAWVRDFHFCCPGDCELEADND